MRTGRRQALQRPAHPAVGGLRRHASPGQTAADWAEGTRRTSDLGSQRRASWPSPRGDRAYAFLAPDRRRSAASTSTTCAATTIEPGLRAQRLGRRRGRRRRRPRQPPARPGSRDLVRWFGMLVALAVIASWCCCCGCGSGGGGASAGRPSSPRRSRVDPADPNALAPCRLDALDDLSKSIVVDVDNAVRTSENELALGGRGIRRQGHRAVHHGRRPTRRRRWRRRSTCARSSTTQCPRPPRSAAIC